MRKKGTEEKSYTVRQVVIAVALESGRGIKDAAEVLGVTARRTYDVAAMDENAIQELRALIKPVTRATVSEIKQVALDNFREALEGDIGIYVDAIRRAASDADARTALQGALAGLSYTAGKPKSTLEVTGGTRNETTYKFAPEVLAAISGGVLGSQALHESARQIESGKLIDVTPQ